ncbi:MAG: MFS transporter [Alphaproteobacteria bacterium]|nr:MFS transporter [Alphaproteobacteria bacterium]
MAVGVAMSVLDAAMVNVALPTISRDLAIHPATATWVVNAYQLALVGLLLPCAALGEVLGFRRVYQVGLCIYLLGALGSAFAPGLEWLLASRVMQGVGSAAVMSLTAGLMRNIYPTAQLGRAIGINAFTVAFCSAVGPSIGSLIITVAGWHMMFFLAVPIGLGVLLLGQRALPDVPPQKRAFDLAGAALTMVTFASIILGLDLLLVAPWLGVPVLGLGLAALWLLLRVAAGHAAPVLPLDLLRIRVVRLAVGASSCMFGAQAMLYVTLPFHLTAAGRSVAEIGLILSAWPAAIAVAAPLAGRFSDRVSSALLPAAGAALVALGLLVIAGLDPRAPAWWMMLALAFCGAGFGSFQAPNNRAMLAVAPRARAGVAGGMQSTARVLGQATGTMLVALCFHAAVATPWVLGVAGCAAMVAAGLCVWRGR